MITNYSLKKDEVTANKIDVQYRKLGVRFLIKILSSLGLKHTNIYKILTNQISRS